jgi:O-antigen/teichoic acid export membrane protein
MVIIINKVVKNFLSISFANLVSQVLTFLVVAYYAHILGPNEFGDLSTVQALMLYFTMFVMLGLQTYGTREVSKAEANINYTVGNIALLRVIAFFISYIILFVFSFFNKGNTVFNNLLLLYGITLLPSALNLEWVFSGLQEMQHNAMYNLIKTILPCVLIFIFFKNKQQIFLIPIFTSAGLFAALIYQLYIYFINKRFNFLIKLKFENFIQYIRFGLPFMMSGILAMINCNVDRIVIRFTRSAWEAGVYSAGYNIIMFLTNIVTLIFIPFFPLLIKFYHTKELQELKKIIDNIVRIIALIAVPIFVGGVLLSKEIILLLFGEKYLGGHVSFAILMIYILILFIREIYGYCLNAWNLERKYLKIVFISSMVNLILNLVFTRYYGMNIAAIITVLSEVINLFLMRRFANNVLKIHVLKQFRNTLVPTIIMGVAIIVLKYLNINVLVNVFVAMIIYFAAVIKFKYISIEELRMLISKKEGSI